MDFTELELVLRAGRFGWACLHPCERSVSKSYVWRGDILGYFLEKFSQPPIWNSQMSRTFENSSKPKNQIAFFKCILNWVLRQKNSNNLWRSRVSLTGLIHEKKKPDLLLIYILCWCGVCLSVTFCHYANLYIMLMWRLTWQPAPPWIGKLSPKAPELSPLKRPI